MSYLNYQKKELFFDSVSISEIAKKYPTPFYLYSESALLSQYKAFQKTVNQFELGEDHLICFALKANPNPFLLESLFKLGAGADTVSGGELQRALQCGCDPQKIVFSGVGKTRQEIEFALGCHELGIYSFNVESIEELDLINTVAKEMNKMARVAIRLNPKVNAKTHKFISTGYKTHKFGILKEDILELFTKINSYDSIKLVGLSIHIGSQLTDFKATKKAVLEVCKLALHAPEPLEFIDFGGGLGVDYKGRDPEYKLNEYMHSLAEGIYEAELPYHPRVLFEPGRFLSASAGVFVTKVIRTKQSDKVFFAIVDGGMNDFVRTSLYEAYHKIIPVVESGEKKVATEIVGPICETSDSFASGRKIQKLKADELIVVCDTGAYGHSMSSTYNLRRRPIELTLTTHSDIVVHEH
ncbi:MAG: diaminopimelate decarboxylase [Halobacteriovoraceae bacterium]|nr:diaminopimelate decarboxylase [Halobacteriovoraceae bacterium]|tara:strand:+ start:9166 stop:10398 length:1233 start_codon:yes stop_codon:yes gene_type:complete